LLRKTNSQFLHQNLLQGSRKACVKRKFRYQTRMSYPAWKYSNEWNWVWWRNKVSSMVSTHVFWSPASSRPFIRFISNEWSQHRVQGRNIEFVLKTRTQRIQAQVKDTFQAWSNFHKVTRVRIVLKLKFQYWISHSIVMQLH